MKKIFKAAVLSVALLLSFSACAKSGSVKGYNYDLSKYITLPEYKGLEAVAYDYEVTDEQVALEVLAMRGHYARYIAVTGRGAEENDFVTIDYSATVDGKAYSDSSKTDVKVYLGSESHPQALSDALVGKVPGDTLSVDVTLDSRLTTDQTVLGKTATISATVKAVETQELPNYTDDYVRAYLGYDSIAEYEAGIKEMLEEDAKVRYYSVVIEQVWPIVLENTEVIKYPEKEVDDMYNSYMDAHRAYAEALGFTFTQYAKLQYDMTEEELSKSVMDTVHETIKAHMVCHAIARAEKIDVTEEEYTKRATYYALNNYDYDSLEEFEEVYDKDTLRQSVLFDMIQEFVADNAKIKK